MGWTKGQYVEQALVEIGLAPYFVDMQPEQLNSVLVRLDNMMATWNAQGIRLGYPLNSSPQNSSLDDLTNIPDSANQAVVSNLAVSIAPIFGKQLTIETKKTARDGYKALLSIAARPNEMQYIDTLPLGAGNKPFSISQPFVNTPRNDITVGGDLDTGIEL